MSSNSFATYLQPAGQVQCANGQWALDIAACGDAACPPGVTPLADGSCQIDTRSATDRAQQDATARRNQDFQLAGTLTTAIAHLAETLGAGIINADTTRQANAYAAQTQQMLANLREQQASSNPTIAADATARINALIAENERLHGAMGSNQGSSMNKTLLVVGAVALAGAVGIGAYMLSRKPRKNPVVGHGRNRHFVKASKMKGRKRAR